VSALRAAHPVFRRRRFFNGRSIRPAAPSQDQADVDYQRDIAWFTSSGEEMDDEDWEAGAAVLTVFLNGEGIAEADERGQRVVDDSFLLIFNAHHEDVEVTLPGAGLPDRWATVLDTVDGTVVVGTARTSSVTTVDELPDDLETLGGGDTVTMTARSTLLLQRTDVQR
jgi:glycogen operon protein